MTDFDRSANRPSRFFESATGASRRYRVLRYRPGGKPKCLVKFLTKCEQSLNPADRAMEVIECAVLTNSQGIVKLTEGRLPGTGWLGMVVT